MNGSDLPRNPPPKVVLVEDNRSYREHVREVFEQHRDTATLLATFPDAESALPKLPELAPDVVLVDIELPGQSGIALVEKLHGRMKETRFLMLTIFPDYFKIRQAREAGASGYLLKEEVEDSLMEKIAELHTKQAAPMSPKIAWKVWQASRLQAAGDLFSIRLTHREEEIASALADGRKHAEIAARLKISTRTVEKHAEKIFFKLGVRSRAEVRAALDRYWSGQ